LVVDWGEEGAIGKNRGADSACIPKGRKETPTNGGKALAMITPAGFCTEEKEGSPGKGYFEMP